MRTLRALVVLVAACAKPNPGFVSEGEVSGSGSRGETSTTTSTAGGASEATTGAPTTTAPVIDTSGSSAATTWVETTVSTTSGSTTSGSTTRGSATDGSSSGSSGGEDPAVSCAADDVDLAACYHFPPGETEVLVDATPKPEDGAISGLVKLEVSAPGLGVAAVVGPATRMTVTEDGQTDDLDVPLAITFMAAVRLDEPPAGTRVGVLDKEGQYSIFIGADGKLSCQVAGVKLSGPVIPVGGWIHLACSYEGMKVRMVINGQPIVDALSVEPIQQNQGALELGGNSPGMDNVGLDRMTGALDAVEIWSRVLLPEEICVRAGALCEP